MISKERSDPMGAGHLWLLRVPGKPPTGRGSTLDITERKQAEDRPPAPWWSSA